MTTAVLAEDRASVRLGLKGPAAIDWLQRNGIDVPQRSNTWTGFAGDDADIPAGVIVRLGSTEFLIESNPTALKLPQLADALAEPIAGVYPVLREDRAFELSGAGADNVLAQVCNVNFSALTVDERPAVMTMMIGVAVTVVPQGKAARRRYRIWCDPSYGDYLWSSLANVVDDR